MQKKALLALTTAISLGISTAYAQTQDPEMQMVNQTAALLSSLALTPDLFWPGFNINKTPTILYFPESKHTYTFNLKPTRNEAGQLAEGWNTFDGKIYYLLDDKLGIDHFKPTNEAPFMTINDQPSFVYKTVTFNTDNEIDKRYILDAYSQMLTARFAIYALAESKFIAPFISGPEPVYHALHNKEINKLTYLEFAAFQDYLQTKNSAALQMAIAIEQYRYTLLKNNLDSQKYITMQNLIEGPAQYIAAKTLKKSVEDYANDIMMTYFHTAPDHLPDYCNTDCLIGYEWLLEANVTLSFSQYGALIGFILDQVQPTWTNPGLPWKKQVEAGTSANAVLLKHYKMQEPEINAWVEAAKRSPSYQYDKIDRFVEATLTPIIKDINTQLTSYNQLSGTALSIDTSSSIFLRGKQLYQIDPMLVLITDLSGELLDTNDNIQVTYTHLPYLFWRQPNISNRNMWQFKLIPGTTLHLDDSDTTVENFVASGQTVNFHQLTLANSQISMTFGKEGTLKVVNGKLQLTIANPAIVTK